MYLANIIGDKIVIEVDKTSLPFAVDYYNDNFYSEFGETVITNLDELLKDVCIELNREDEEGTTLLHLALDKALANAIDNGSLGVDEGPVRCSECAINYADVGTTLCPGCHAYRDHTA